MPVEARPLFRPDVLRRRLFGFPLPATVEALRPRLLHWATLIESGRIDGFKEQQLLPDFLTDFFVGILGYTRPADGGQRYTLDRETRVEVDGKFADAVLGDFNGDRRHVVALEGKGPRDPLDRPFAGRAMSAVDQDRLAILGHRMDKVSLYLSKASEDLKEGIISQEMYEDETNRWRHEVENLTKEII